jgi:hypothetical protein
MSCGDRVAVETSRDREPDRAETFTTAMIASAIPAAISPYSIAVVMAGRTLKIRTQNDRTYSLHHGAGCGPYTAQQTMVLL